ncbi:MAG: hypothetical protein HRT44_03400 [Bdellovibrionales bacterium]|nr:hypothetical protein [Bdellovibrionales bacterium]NQZ18293.1 hypothetical protein [Bdellovibrionales bacterium]
MNRHNLERTIKAIRIMGVLAMILSAVIFLYQGFSAWNGFERFLIFSGINACLGGLGMFCATKWKETKGARTFLGLATAGVSAQFAQLGSILYSYIHGTGHFSDVLNVSVESHTELIITIALTLFIGVPLSLLGYKVFNRKEALYIGGLGTLMNLSLLIPMRESVTTLLITTAFIVAAYLIVNSKNLLRNNLISPEKLISYALVFAPAAILMGRNVFYAADSLFFIAFFMILGAFQLCIYQFKKTNNQELYNQRFYLFLWSLGIWGNVVYLMFESFELVPVALVGIAVAPFYVLMRYYIIKTKRVDASHKAFVLFSSMAITASSMIEFNFISASVLGVLGVVLAIDGYQSKIKVAFGWGVAMKIVSVFMALILTIDTVNIFHWLNLAIIGGLAILATSYLEKNEDKLRDVRLKFEKHF